MKGLIYFDTRYTILDRHHAWRSLEPTLDISLPFMKAFYLLFLERRNFLQKCIISFALGYPLPPSPVYSPTYPHTYPSSYLMLPNLINQFIKLSNGNLPIFSANEIRTFLKKFL